MTQVAADVGANLKSYAEEYGEICEEMSKLKQQLNALKQQKNELMPVIISMLKEIGITNAQLNGTHFSIKNKKSIAPLKKEDLINMLQTKVDLDQETASSVVIQTLNDRPVKNTEQLNLRKASV